MPIVDWCRSDGRPTVAATSGGRNLSSWIRASSLILKVFQSRTDRDSNPLVVDNVELAVGCALRSGASRAPYHLRLCGFQLCRGGAECCNGWLAPDPPISSNSIRSVRCVRVNFRAGAVVAVFGLAPTFPSVYFGSWRQTPTRLVEGMCGFRTCALILMCTAAYR
jgi:hypothetical protein